MTPGAGTLASMQRRTLAMFLLPAALAVAGCSSDTQESISTDLQSAATDVGDAVGEAADDAVEVAARNLATQQGEEQFANAGHALDGPLECTASVADGATKVDIDCAGTTQDGGVATLIGQTDELPGASVVSLDGQFVGAVDGTTVFETERLGG